MTVGVHPQRYSDGWAVGSSVSEEPFLRLGTFDGEPLYGSQHASSVLRDCSSCASWFTAFGSQTLSVTRGHTADLEVVKRFLQEQHVASVTRHLVLNNTTSTRPKLRGGPVVHSISKLKQFDMTGAGSATPMHRCILRLPHSFAAIDGKEVEAIGCGATQQEADGAACCEAMAKLLCAEPFNVVLHQCHWKMSTIALVEEVLRITGRQVPTLEPQLLAVPPSRPWSSVYARPSGSLTLAAHTLAYKSNIG